MLPVRALSWLWRNRSLTAIVADDNNSALLAVWSVLALGSGRALVAIDLPFGSYERSAEQAFDTTNQIMMETGAQAVKVEAADGVAESIAF